MYVWNARIMAKKPHARFRQVNVLGMYLNIFIFLKIIARKIIKNNIPVAAF
jgi:hypothetical protein